MPFRVPPDHVLPERLAAVLGVLHPIFNRGYAGRDDLAGEAIRLTRVLTALMPDEPRPRIAVLETERPIDWPQVVGPYDELVELTRSPVVELNRAAALASAGPPSRRSSSSSGSTSTATSTCTRRGPSCCLGSAATTRPWRSFAGALDLAAAEHERRFVQRRIDELGVDGRV